MIDVTDETMGMEEVPWKETNGIDPTDDANRMPGTPSMITKLPENYGNGEYVNGCAVSALYDFYPVITEGRMFNEPMVTVCTAYNGIDFGRGVAVRSVDDEWDQHKAFFVARCYAVRALKGRPDKFITDKRAISVLAKTMCPWVKHSDGNPMVTWRERKILLSRGDFAKTVDKAGFGFSERFRVKTGISFRVNEHDVGKRVGSCKYDGNYATVYCNGVRQKYQELPETTHRKGHR